MTDERWDGSASRYSDEEYRKATVLDRNDCQDASDMPAKERYSLPVANPGSSWSDNPDPGGVQAAWGGRGLSAVNAPAACKTAAAKRLVRAAGKLDLEVPEAITQMANRSAGRLQRGEIRARFAESGVSPFELRAEEGDGKVVLQGYIAPFNEWTEIDSLFEGRFMERIAPTAFNKALQERRPKVLFQHGHDPSIGDKPIGVPRLIEARDQGEWYEVDLFAETSYVGDLLPAMRAGELGTSFRFTSIKEVFDRDPGESDHNPAGIPERTVTEATLPEFGPVTFPAYDGATANIRSVLTEEHFIVAERTATVSNEEPEPITSEPEPTPSLGGSRKRRRDYLGATQAAPWKI